jgi:hypothetical protein
MSTDNIIEIAGYIEQSDAEENSDPDTYEWEVSSATMGALEQVLNEVSDERILELIENYSERRSTDAFSAGYRFGHKNALQRDE